MQVGAGASRAIAAATLAPAAALSLPIAATFLDHPPGRENWILPAQLGGMGLLGAGIGATLPALVSSTAGRGRGALVGAGLGIAGGIVADVAMFTLLT